MTQHNPFHADQIHPETPDEKLLCGIVLQQKEGRLVVRDVGGNRPEEMLQERPPRRCGPVFATERSQGRVRYLLPSKSRSPVDGLRDVVDAVIVDRDVIAR